ncbi:MAG: protein NO VEIN domain-containing protein, partial [Halobacteriaceae archaeon]
MRDEDVAGLLGEIFSTILEVDVRHEVYILATAPNREKAFSIISGKDTATVSEAQKRLQTQSESGFPAPDIKRNQPYTSPSSADSAKDSPPNEPQIEDSNQQSPPAIQENTEVKTKRRNIDTIDKQNISIRRVNTGTTSPTTRGRREVADANRAENVCLKFEESEGRYPIKVANIQGSKSYRCDIISFNSKERRQRFQEEYDTSLIDRYIEVKARTTQKDSITLKGNQLAAARDHQEKYFLYRAYEHTDDASEYEVVVLRSPLGHAGPT